MQNLHVASRPFLAGDAAVAFLRGGLELRGAPPFSDYPSLLGATSIRLEAEPERSRLSFLAGLLALMPDSELMDLLYPRSGVGGCFYSSIVSQKQKYIF